MPRNRTERLKERIAFLSRILLAYIAGLYLLAGAIGGYLIEWLSRDEFSWSDFGIVPTIAVVAFLVLTVLATRQYRRIDRYIDQV